MTNNPTRIVQISDIHLFADKDNELLGVNTYQSFQALLDLLEDCLKKYPAHHAIVAFHHQPLPVGATWLDMIGLQNADELWAILAQYPNSHTILFGHVHQEFQAEKNGIRCYSTPSTCVQ